MRRWCGAVQPIPPQGGNDEILAVGAAHARCSGVASHHIFLVRPGRDDALMEFMELVPDGSLLFLVLAVHPNDEVVCRFDALEVGVVPVAKQKLAARRRMRSHSPAARLVTVVLLHELIDGRRDSAEDAELCDIRSEP